MPAVLTDISYAREHKQHSCIERVPPHMGSDSLVSVRLCLLRTPDFAYAALPSRAGAPLAATPHSYDCITPRASGSI